MSFEQYAYLTTLLHSAPGQSSKLLVWGLGGDSGLWKTVNRRGRTAFLENHPDWIQPVRTVMPGVCWANTEDSPGGSGARQGE
jgi:hypothetical protein